MISSFGNWVMDLLQYPYSLASLDWSHRYFCHFGKTKDPGIETFSSEDLVSFIKTKVGPS